MTTPSEPCDRYEVTNGAGVCTRCGFMDDRHVVLTRADIASTFTMTRADIARIFDIPLSLLGELDQ